MLKVVESFSGIGSQVKALKRIGIEYEILATMDWDINAIIAYDIIHHGKPELGKYINMSKEELRHLLKKYMLSGDGKSQLTVEAMKRLTKVELEHLVAAINRSNNLTSITEVAGEDLADEIDLFTYSFPCQDLSIAGAWHGNNTGIDRTANNRSGMLWQVERILFERRDLGLKLPKFLLMENVTNILSKSHRENFKEWQAILEGLGYYNVVYTLNAEDFGIPQKRKRVFMVSIKCDINQREKLDEYINNNDLSTELYRQKLDIKRKKIEDILKVNYSKDIYKLEANESQPNETPSRVRIYNENDKIFINGKYNEKINVISTITTKQDRNPNAGVIEYDSKRNGKANFRYLTPRECFILMGFDEEDYETLMENNFSVNKGRKFFTHSKLYKLAGNSIVVNVLEYIFKQIEEINNNIL